MFINTQIFCRNGSKRSQLKFIKSQLKEIRLDTSDLRIQREEQSSIVRPLVELALQNNYVNKPKP